MAKMNEVPRPSKNPDLWESPRPEEEGPSETWELVGSMELVGDLEGSSRDIAAQLERSLRDRMRSLLE
ncbi:MAG TPA: hypothetical protein VI756_20175 [Blastocatellia bacterium]